MSFLRKDIDNLMTITAALQVQEMEEIHEQDKQIAMRELTEALIPRIEEEMLSTHR